MRSVIAIVLLGLGVAGCATITYDKPGASAQDFKTDAYSCEKDARQSGYFGTGIIGSMNMQGFYKKCMEAHGYTQHVQ